MEYIMALRSTTALNLPALWFSTFLSHQRGKNNLSEIYDDILHFKTNRDAS